MDISRRKKELVEEPGEREKSIASVGMRLRLYRNERGMSLRVMASQLSVSASFLSQLETGKSQASVATLYAICDCLGISMEELFQSLRKSNTDDAKDVGSPSDEIVVRANERTTVYLDSGVTWERLTTMSDKDVDFMRISYPVGGSSTSDDSFLRHSGREYHFVILGQLEICLGFEKYEVGAGDSISFDSSIPHRLANVGEVPVVAITAVVGRYP